MTMKRIFLLTAFVIGISFSLFGQRYSAMDLNNEAPLLNKKGTTYITSNNRQPVLATYTDRTLFQNDYILQSGQALTSEDFSSGPSGINICGTVISSTGDDCYLQGELVDGFSVTSTTDAGGGEVVSIASGNIGNSIHLVGANEFIESTIVNFSVDVYAVGLDIWNGSDPMVSFRVYDAGGNLLEDYILTNTVSTENFFGVIANEPISRVEVQEFNGGGDLIGNLEFGEAVLSISEFNESQVSIYPNPITSKLNIDIASNVEIEKVTLYNILGKNTGLTFANGSINTSSLSSGVYLLMIESSEGVVSKKVIKQ